MDENTQQAIEGIHNGTLAQDLSRNMRFSLAGVAFGWAAGVVIASLCGQSKFLFGLSGAALGATIGYISSNKTKK